MSKIDPRELRRSLGTFATGVTIITTIDSAGEPRGFTANSFTSVSLDPPLVLVCIAKEAGSLDAFENAESYAVNILSEKQRDLSTLFASRGENRYADVSWTKKTTGSPILNGTAAWLDCTMEQTIDAGDHIILMGKVVAHEHNAEPILGYCRGAYVSLESCPASHGNRRAGFPCSCRWHYRNRRSTTLQAGWQSATTTGRITSRHY